MQTRVTEQTSSAAAPAASRLKVGQAGDRFEREADAVADQVLAMPARPVAVGGGGNGGVVQRACSACTSEKHDEPLRMKAGAGGGAPQVSESVQSGIDAQRRSGGAPLPAGSRAFLEPRFGRPLDGVRVHQGHRAASLASDLGARAFTVGSDIFFNRDQYRPESRSGMRLLAHELTHTIQQNDHAAPSLQREGMNVEAVSRPLAASMLAANGGGLAGVAAVVGAAIAANGVAGLVCAGNFAPVSFTLAGATGRSTSPSATARVTAGATPQVAIVGTAAAGYTPTITITAPSNAVASQFEVGIIQNLMVNSRNATYSGGTTTSVAPNTTPPMKDGAPASSGMFDIDFAENGGGHPNILVPFTAAGGSASLVLPDTPSYPAFVNVLDDPTCPRVILDQTLTMLSMHSQYRTWVGVRHRPSGCVKTIHHIDWNVNWDLEVTVPAGGGAPATRFIHNSVDVTTANGNGAPAYVRGGPVPADGRTTTCTP